MAFQTFYKKELLRSDCNKPYIITNNRFQLLENFHENVSPANLPSEISQPGKDYRSAVKVRSASLEGEGQMTKYIGKTHFHNANFYNQDSKINPTTPVPVQVQVLISKSNPVKRQSSKSHRKYHRLLIIGDSHTRLCATNVKPEIRYNYDVQGLVKPGAGAGRQLNTTNSDITILTKKML